MKTAKECREYYYAHPELFPQHEEVRVKINDFGKVGIDKNMVDIITTLNNKGYYTEACCEGSPWFENIGTFILFADEYEFTELPKGFYESKFHHHRKAIHVYTKDVEKKFRKNFPNTEEANNFKMEHIGYLLSWANNLPNRKAC